jgi:hypothetical protein
LPSNIVWLILFKSASWLHLLVAVAVAVLRLRNPGLSHPLYEPTAQFVWMINCAVFWPATTTFVLSASVRNRSTD